MLTGDSRRRGTRSQRLQCGIGGARRAIPRRLARLRPQRTG